MSDPSSILHYRISKQQPDQYITAQRLEQHARQCVIETDTFRSATLAGAVLPVLRDEIVRVDFVRAASALDDSREVRGAFCTDDQGYIVLHIVNALIGYDGSGPELSRVLLDLIGLPRLAFQELNAIAKPTEQRYALRLDVMR